MTAPLSTEAAREIVAQSLRTVVPGTVLDTVDPDEDLREVLELDSLDFLAFVERLSERSGRRIEEDDYDKLDTLDSCVRFLSDAAS
jgi:acyl carrier protein